MALPGKPSGSSGFDVTCPCCQSVLKIDPVLQTVLTHKEPERAKPIEDLASAVQRLKGEAARRDEIFEKSKTDLKSRQQVLNAKFDELLKQAQADPDKKPKKPLGLE